MSSPRQNSAFAAPFAVGAALFALSTTAARAQETLSLSDYQQVVRDYKNFVNASKPDKTRANELARKLRQIKTVAVGDGKTVTVDLSPDADALTGEPPKNKKPFESAARRANALQILVVPQTAAPDAANAKAQAAAILARAEFNVEPEKDNTPGWLKATREWFARQWRAFWRWIADWWGRLFPAPKVSPGALVGFAYFMRFLLFFVVAVGTIIGLYFLATYLSGKKRGGAKKGSGKGTTGLDLDEDAFPDPLGAARELASRGDYREAVRLAYIASLRRLAGSGLLTLQENRTNWEYQRTLRSRSQSAYDVLLPGTRLFDRIWYGRQNATRDEYEQAVALHDALPAPLLPSSTSTDAKTTASAPTTHEKPLAGAGSKPAGGGGDGVNPW